MERTGLKMFVIEHRLIDGKHKFRWYSNFNNAHGHWCDNADDAREGGLWHAELIRRCYRLPVDDVEYEQRKLLCRKRKRKPQLGLDDRCPVGKYKGKTIEWIVVNDYEELYNLEQNGIVKLLPSISERLAEYKEIDDMYGLHEKV